MLPNEKPIKTIDARNGWTILVYPSQVSGIRRKAHIYDTTNLALRVNGFDEELWVYDAPPDLLARLGVTLVEVDGNLRYELAPASDDSMPEFTVLQNDPDTDAALRAD